MWSHLRSFSCVFLACCSRGSLVRRVLRSSRFSSRREETRAGTLAHAVAAAETDTERLMRGARSHIGVTGVDRALSVPTGATTQARDPDPTR